MGLHQLQPELFSYQVNLDKRVRPDHPLRRVAESVDFSFMRAQIASYYGSNGNESVDPVFLLKMMFLLFYENVASERELMAVIAERPDYLWFLGYGLDDEIPDHSVLSKARRRWRKDVFQRLFVRTIEQCVVAGLISGSKLHVDASLIMANASKDSVVKSSPELIAAFTSLCEKRRVFSRGCKKSSGGAPMPQDCLQCLHHSCSVSFPDNRRHSNRRAARRERSQRGEQLFQSHHCQPSLQVVAKVP